MMIMILMEMMIMTIMEMMIMIININIKSMMIIFSHSQMPQLEVNSDHKRLNTSGMSISVDRVDAS